MGNILDDDLSCLRIRSDRRRLRAKKEDYDKMLLRLGRQERELYQQIRSLGWIELKPPVQRGFIRIFVLRHDVKKTRQADFFEGILNKINTTQWSADPFFKRKRKRFGKKVYTVREQRLRDIEPPEFEKEFSAKEKVYFYQTLTTSRQSKKPYTVYRFAEPWRFVLRVQPDMITKVRVKDLDLERECVQIGKYFENVMRRKRLQKLQSGTAFRWEDPLKDKYKSPLDNRSFHDILGEYLPEQAITVSFRNPRSDEGFLFGFYLTAYCFVLIDAITTSIRRICPRLVKENTPSFREKFKHLWK